MSLHNTETSAELDNLQPGTRYTVTVVTEAVGLQSFTSEQAVTGTYYGMFLGDSEEFLRTQLVVLSVPAQLAHLRLDNNGSSHSLLGSWASPEGGVDSYLLTLSAHGSTLQQHLLPPNTTQLTLEGLSPGRSYQLSVQTRVGQQSTETTARGGTGESSPVSPEFCLQVSHRCTPPS